MMATQFNKSRVLAFSDALNSGEPLQPNAPASWSPAEIIEIGGVCLHYLVSNWHLIRIMIARAHGQVWEFPKSREYAEAQAVDVRQNTELAFGAVMAFLFAISDGRYDHRYEPILQILLNADAEDPMRKVQILSGLKETPEGYPTGTQQPGPCPTPEPEDQRQDNAE